MPKMPQSSPLHTSSNHTIAATPGAEHSGEAVLSTIRQMAAELGFAHIGVASIDLQSAESGLLAWLAAGFHGDMHYMAAHGLKRARPAELVPGTVSVITARMDYLPATTPPDWRTHERARQLAAGEAVISLYARGRDYHKVMRQRLQQLAQAIAAHVGMLGHRVFTDSAPVLEVELASRSGLGWRGKHTLLVNKQAGSTFFLGEIYIDMALPATPATSAHCGNCQACISACPTGAIVAPWRLDARRCISYLTIEHAGSIPPELRPLIGNRIYGCDDCQLACPWNKFAQRSPLPDFAPRHGLQSAQLLQLWQWDEATFLQRTEGSPIRRIGYTRWLRNLAVALGNALRQSSAPHACTTTSTIAASAPNNAAGNTPTPTNLAAHITAALQSRAQHPEALVREHVQWALAQRQSPPSAPSTLYNTPT